jgi:hypothetical protein
MILNTIYALNHKEPPLSVCGSIKEPEKKNKEEKNIVYGNFVWTEGNFFNEKIEGLIDKDIVEGRIKKGAVYEPGVSMDRLTEVLNKQGLSAKAIHVGDLSEKSIEEFRSLIKKSMLEPSQFVIANYNLNILSEIQGGHFSPIGAYNEKEDKILILDVWSAFGPRFWIDLKTLYKSMHTKDSDTFRGYILIQSKL